MTLSTRCCDLFFLFFELAATFRGKKLPLIDHPEQLKAVLEINVDHPVVSSLRKTYEIAPDSADSKQTALLLYDIAALTGGYSIDDPNAFAQRVTTMLTDRIGEDGEEVQEEGGVKDAEVVG